MSGHGSSTLKPYGECIGNADRVSLHGFRSASSNATPTDAAHVTGDPDAGSAVGSTAARWSGGDDEMA